MKSLTKGLSRVVNVKLAGWWYGLLSLPVAFLYFFYFALVLETLWMILGVILVDWLQWYRRANPDYHSHTRFMVVKLNKSEMNLGKKQVA